MKNRNIIANEFNVFSVNEALGNQSEVDNSNGEYVVEEKNVI